MWRSGNKWVTLLGFHEKRKEIWWFPGFLLFFPTETSSETPNLGPENGLNKGCLRAGRSQGGLSLSQSLPALDMLDPNGWKCVWSSQFNPDQPLHHSLSLFQILKSWYNGHPNGPSTSRFTNPPSEIFPIPVTSTSRSRASTRSFQLLSSHSCVPLEIIEDLLAFRQAVSCFLVNDITISLSLHSTVYSDYLKYLMYH